MRPKQLPADIHWPTDEEEAAIQRGIAADPDAPEWTDEDFARARPAREAVPEIVEWHERRVRGPQKAPTKKLTSLRLDRDVLAGLKASGPGWQSRANALLRKAVVEESEIVRDADAPHRDTPVQRDRPPSPAPQRRDAERDADDAAEAEDR
jgi:uncharacterized protein (DUF4415 family)